MASLVPFGLLCQLAEQAPKGERPVHLAITELKYLRQFQYGIGERHPPGTRTSGNPNRGSLAINDI